MNLVDCLCGFVREIGLECRFADLPGPTFLPGVTVEGGAVVVDRARLRYPGDILHEAGHLAVMSPERRDAMAGDAGGDPAEEMMAIAWSYAAAMRLGIDPAIVFHPDGYRGGSGALLANFAAKRFIGVPMLQWLGLALDERAAAEHGLEPFPVMQRWIRTGQPG